MINKNNLNFKNTLILVVGGAGFVGSNLIDILLTHSKKILIIDNLLSSEIINVSEDKSVEFIQGSITDDKILGRLPSEIELRFSFSMLSWESIIYI